MRIHPDGHLMDDQEGPLHLQSDTKSFSTPGGRSRFAKARSYALLVLLSIVWGLAFAAIKRADFELSPPSLTLLRWLVASAGLLALVPFVKAKSAFDRRDLPRLILMSLTNVAGYHLSLNYAEARISSGLAGLLLSLGPVFIVLLSTILLHEKAGVRVIVALGLATAGSLMLSLADISAGSAALVGSLLVIVTALCYAIFAVASKPLVVKYGALPTLIWVGLLGTAFILPLATPDFFSELRSLSNIGWLSVLYLALPSTVLGYGLFYTLVGKGAVSTLSIQLYLIPIVSVAAGVLLLGEHVTAYTFLGGAALLSAVALTNRPKG
jgi:O-acetylserine/cysteine efflux transporter